MEFQKKWINWVLETGDDKSIAKIGQKCYQDNEWVKKLPMYTGEKEPETIVAFLKEQLPEFTFTVLEKGFRVNLNGNECFCPLVQSGITKNKKLCHCTKTFDKKMYENILCTKVQIRLLKTILRGAKSCVFEITLTE